MAQLDGSQAARIPPLTFSTGVKGAHHPAWLLKVVGHPDPVIGAYVARALQGHLPASFSLVYLVQNSSMLDDIIPTSLLAVM